MTNLFCIIHAAPRSYVPCETEAGQHRTWSVNYQPITGHAMKPTDIQQFAIQAKLSMQLGAEIFDTMFAGIEIAGLSDGEMRVLVRSERCAKIIEENHLGMLAVIVESILRRPVKFVTVVPKNVGGWSER
jgi:hypothetical protein